MKKMVGLFVERQGRRRSAPATPILIPIFQIIAKSFAQSFQQRSLDIAIRNN